MYHYGETIRKRYSSYVGKFLLVNFCAVKSLFNSLLLYLYTHTYKQQKTFSLKMCRRKVRSNGVASRRHFRCSPDWCRQPTPHTGHSRTSWPNCGNRLQWKPQRAPVPGCWTPTRSVPRQQPSRTPYQLKTQCWRLSWRRTRTLCREWVSTRVSIFPPGLK